MFCKLKEMAVFGVLASSLILLLSSCGGDGGGTSSATHTIGGTVSGLAGTVVLQNNSGDDLTVSSDGSFTFNTALASGDAYAVTVLTQPSGQICTVSNGSGAAAANIDTVTVQCVATWTGTKQLGVAGASTFGLAVATDASSNVYVAGHTYGGLDGNTLTGTSDFFVAKYNSEGIKQYSRQLGVAGASTSGNSVATDASGNVYVAGYTNGGLDGNTLTGTTDFFVTKYNSEGVKQYTRQLGVAGASTSGSSVATDASGNVYVAGSTTGGLDGNTRTGTTDFFVTKYNSEGIKQYTRQLGVAGAYTSGKSVATDASGNVYVAGSTTGGLDGNTLAGTSNFFVTKYSSEGIKQYTRQSGAGSAAADGHSVATDASGNVHVVGITNFGMMGSSFVTKYDSNGVEQYTREWTEGSGGGGFTSVATDANGNAYLTGYTYPTQTEVDSIFAKFDSNGVKQYTRQLGVAGRDTRGVSVTTDASGNAYVAGWTNAGLDGNTLTGTSDFFVTKYSSDGVKQ